MSTCAQPSMPASSIACLELLADDKVKEIDYNDPQRVEAGV